ncbi:MAG: hypothetical protein QOI18_1488, partial [Solirubrobacteraceae bacterium]|nr:hypothetical protein [Solirubrobacteraceae bacterium]
MLAPLTGPMSSIRLMSPRWNWDFEDGER